MHSTKRNITLFSYYRIIAAYLVLVIHWNVCHKPALLERVCGVAVPLFAAMAGCLFAMYSEKINFVSFLKKKARRILLPYAIWAVIYWLANNIILDMLVRKQGFVVPNLQAWLLGWTSSQLWFLPALFYSFILFGFLFSLTNCNKARAIFAVLSLCAGVATQLLCDGYLSLYLGRLFLFFTLGAIVGMLREHLSRKLCLILGSVGTALGITIVCLKLIPGLSWNPMILVLSLVMLAIADVDVPVPSLISKLADGSMGVYLVHVLFTSGAMFLLAKWCPLHPCVGFAVSVVLFGFSTIVAMMLPRWMR